MVEGEIRDEEVLFPVRAGERLRAARVKAGLDLGDVATRTRVPLRHLEGIEKGDYAALPSPTYAIGFAKAYARAIGEDPEDVARLLRDEIGHRQPGQHGELIDLDDTDPARLPGRRLAWTAALIGLAIVIAYGVWRNWLLADPDAPAPEVAATAPESVVPAAPGVNAATNPAGQVVLTASDAVWLRIYDAKDKVLFEKEMARGETFPVPAQADNPMIRTGRPELIAVTIDGKPVAALGAPERMIKDVGISAAALSQRPSVPIGPAAVTGNATAQP